MIANLYKRVPPLMRGMVLIVLSGAMFSGMHASIRYVTGGHTGTDGLHPFEIVFFRNLFSLIIIVPLLMRSGISGLATRRLPMHTLRAVMQAVSMLAFFSALKLSPLADVTALSFVAPLFATIGAIVFLGERARLRRWTALIVGFGGAMIVIRPGFAEVSLGLVYVFIASAVWGASILVIKSLGRTEPSVRTTAYMALLLTPLTLLPALLVWQMPTMEEFAGMFVIGLLGTIGHLALAQSFKEAEVTAILPLDFLRLIWAALFGLALFGEVPEIWTWLGGGVIFASASYVAIREARLRGRTDQLPRQD